MVSSHYAVFKGQAPLWACGFYNRIYLFIKGDDGGEDTPLPIPNRAVKLASADGTAGETLWESRSSPIFICYQAPPETFSDGALCVGPRGVWVPEGVLPGADVG